jgi:hypothetical protein
MSRKGLFSAIVLLLVIGTEISAKAQPHLGIGGGIWQYLGNAHVDGNADHDKISVHGKDTYHALQLRVVGSPVEFDHVVVTYGNHASHTVPTRFRVASGGSSGVIPLAGERDLAWVEIWYRKANWGNRPEVRLYGKP